MTKTTKAVDSTIQTKLENDNILASVIAETSKSAKDSSQLEKPTKPAKVQKVKAEVVPNKAAIVPQKNAAELELARQRIDGATESIKLEISNVANSFCKIGYQLWQVKENKWFEAVGLKNISEYGENYLGFKKSSTSNYISICERFSIRGADGKPTAMLSDTFHLFSYTQLSEMLTVPAEKVYELSPDMTIKDIRAVKKTAATADASAPAAPSELDELYANAGYDIFDRVLTEQNFDSLVRLLRENIGKEVTVTVC